MTQDTNDFEFIEEELKKLKSRFLAADEVLKNLVEIQNQFVELAKTSQIIKKEIADLQAEAKTSLKQIEQEKTTFEQRFAELENTNELRTEKLTEEFSRQLLNMRNELNSTCLDLATKLDSQVNDLNKKFQERLASFQAMPTHLNNLQTEMERVKDDSRNLRNQVQTQVEQQQGKAETSFRKLDRRMRIMQNIIVVLGIVLGFVFLGLVAVALRK